MKAEEISIRLAGEDESLEGFREWLPQAFMSLPHPQFFIAESGEDKEVIALASLRILGKGANKAGRFQLFVVPAHRRKGGGSKLMQVMVEQAKKLKATTLLAGVPLADGSEDRQFFESLEGFSVQRTLHQFAMDTEVAWNYLDPLVRRLKKRGGLPKGYEFVSLEKTDRRRIYDFVLKHLGGIPDSLIERLRGGKGGFLPKLSLVVRTVDGPAAVLLVRKNQRGLVVDTRVVDPKHRGTWVNVALMHTFVSMVRPRGVKEVYFEGDDHLHEDTMKLARRGACKTLESNHLYGCDL